MDSSKKTNYNKLSKFKIDNIDYECIYGCINDNTKKKTLNGLKKIIIHNNVELSYYTGDKLLDLILGDDKKEIINYVKNVIKNYYE